MGCLFYKGPLRTVMVLGLEMDRECPVWPQLGRNPESLLLRRGLDSGEVWDLYRQWLGNR